MVRELTKLELRTVDLDGNRETTINDYMEMKARIKIFVRKWSAFHCDLHSIPPRMCYDLR